MAKRTYKHRKKISSWKKLRLSQKLKRRLKVVALAVMVVVSTLIVTVAVQLYHYFTKPLAAAVGSSEANVVFAGGRFNLLLITLDDAEDPTAMIRDLSVLTLSEVEGEKRIFIVKMPLEAEVNVPQGFGTHSLATVYRLGGLIQPPVNVDLTMQTVESLLAVPLNGYLVVDEFLFDRPSLRSVPPLLGQIRRGVKTNLTFPSILKVYQFVWQSPAAPTALELSVSDFKDVRELDRRLAPEFADPLVIEERLKIQVLNGTDKPGLAFHVARYVTNLGGDVIRLANFETTDWRQSVLVAKDPESHTLRRLKEVLGISDVRGELGGVEERADITLILGLDSYYNL